MLEAPGTAEPESANLLTAQNKIGLLLTSYIHATRIIKRVPIPQSVPYWTPLVFPAFVLLGATETHALAIFLLNPA